MPLFLKVSQTAAGRLCLAAMMLITCLLAAINLLDNTGDYFGGPMPDPNTLIITTLLIYSHVKSVLNTRPQWSMSRPGVTLKHIVTSMPTVYITSVVVRWSTWLDLYLLNRYLVPANFTSVTTVGALVAMLWQDGAALYEASREAVANMHDLLHSCDYSEPWDVQTPNSHGKPATASADTEQRPSHKPDHAVGESPQRKTIFDTCKEEVTRKYRSVLDGLSEQKWRVKQWASNAMHKALDSLPTTSSPQTKPSNVAVPSIEDAASGKVGRSDISNDQSKANHSTRRKPPPPPIHIPHADPFQPKLSSFKGASPTNDSIPSITSHSSKVRHDSSPKAFSAASVAETPAPVTVKDTTLLAGSKISTITLPPQVRLQRPSTAHLKASHAETKRDSGTYTLNPDNVASNQLPTVASTHIDRGTTNNRSAAGPSKRHILKTTLPDKPFHQPTNPSLGLKSSSGDSAQQSTNVKSTYENLHPRPAPSNPEHVTIKPACDTYKVPGSTQRKPTVPQPAQPSANPIKIESQAGTTKTTGTHAKPPADLPGPKKPSTESVGTETKASGTKPLGTSSAGTKRPSPQPAGPSVRSEPEHNQRPIPAAPQPARPSTGPFGSATTTKPPTKGDFPRVGQPLSKPQCKEPTNVTEPVNEEKRDARVPPPTQPSVQPVDAKTEHNASATGRYPRSSATRTERPSPTPPHTTETANHRSARHSEFPSSAADKPATSTERRDHDESGAADETSQKSRPSSSEGLGEDGDIWQSFWAEETAPKNGTQNQKPGSTKAPKSSSDRQKSSDIKQEKATPKHTSRSSAGTDAKDALPKADTAKASKSSKTGASSSGGASANLNKPFDWFDFVQEESESFSPNRSRSGSPRSSASSRTSSSRGRASSANTTPGGTPGSSRASAFNRYTHQPGTYRPPRPSRRCSSKSKQPPTPPPKPQPKPQPRPQARPQAEEDPAYTSKAGYNQKFRGNYKAYNPYGNSPPPQSHNNSGKSQPRYSWGQRPFGDTSGGPRYSSYSYSDGSPGGQRYQTRQEWESSYSYHDYSSREQYHRRYSSKRSEWDSTYGPDYEEDPGYQRQSYNRDYRNQQQRQRHSYTYHQGHPPRQPPPPPPPAPKPTAPVFNPYTVLAIPRTATPAEVRRAYKKASILAHPDKAVHRGVPKEEADARMKDINRAKDILYDNVARCVYHDYGLVYAENSAFVEEEKAKERYRGVTEEMFEEMFRKGLW